MSSSSKMDEAKWGKREDLTRNEVVDPKIVAEQIEAGYDIQADASDKPMTSDPASSLENDQELEEQ